MKSCKTAMYPFGRFAALLLLAVSLLLPCAANAQAAEKTVRVGWYESPFNITDRHGRRTGYAYEYQEKLAAYTGWRYEYVEGNWPELLQMLIDGEIDLLSDVSYAEARAERVLYASEPMGAEEYYLFIAPGNTEFVTGDYSYFNGKKVGVDQGSVQSGLFRGWAEAHGLRTELVEMNCPESEAFAMLRQGELDGIVTLDAYGGADTAVPVFKIGSSDFFFAVNRARPDLLEELNTALSRIQDENRFYNEQMMKKYISTSGANNFLSGSERSWLDGHGTIRVGYQDNFLAFCAADAETGELTGALKDYLTAASGCFANALADFAPVAYPSAAAALEALKNGEVDCMFPSCLGTADGEALDLVMTPALMSSDIYAVVRREDRDSFLEKRQVTAAVTRDNPNYDAVMLDHFELWQTAYYPDMTACLKAVDEGKADCVLTSSYRYNSLAKLCEQYDLALLATGENVSFSFAVNRGDTELYSILTRTTNLVSNTTVNAALNYYSSEETVITVADFVRANPVLVGSVIVAVLALIAIIIIQYRLIAARREADKSQHMVEDLNKQVFVDALTHVRNKGGYDNYIGQLQERLDRGETPEVAVAVFDCDNLKRINDQFGHDQGNVYLLASSRLICRVFQHSPVFRIGGDEFVAVLLGEDFEKRDELLLRFREEQAAITAAAGNRWEQVSVSSGVAVYDPQQDRSLQELIRRADQLMYENKRARKETPQYNF